jgi:peptide/nickel transport system substrate-binding protein
LLFALGFATTCANRKGSDTSASNEELVIGVAEGTLNNTEFGAGQLVNLVTIEALTQIAADGRAQPRLAKSWTWELEDMRLRMRLREDVVLHDGRRFDATVATDALNVAIARGSNRAAYPALRDVSAVKPDGPFEVIVEVSRRSAWLPEDLTVPLDLPVGPYRVVTRSETAVEMERFERYYQGTPSIRRIVLRPFDTLRTTWANLLRGELDLVHDVPADAIEFVRSDEVQVVPVKRWYQFAMAFNSRRRPLQSPLVRRALNLGVDRGAIVADVLNGAGSPSSGPLWPGYWAADASLPPYPFDPAEANDLLDRAGFPVAPSRDGAPAARFQITCLIPENFSVLESIALHVQKNLFNIGVDLQFKVVPLAEFARRMGTGEFDAALLDMSSGPTPGRAWVFWASARAHQGGYNVFGYENAEAERLFELLRTTRNEAAVRSATRRLQRVLLDDPPALFLAWNERARAIRREFAFPDEPGVDPVFTLWRWTRRPDTLVAGAP